MRRLVVDLASAGTAWRVPPAALQAIRDALGPGWEVVEVVAPAATEGDGVLGTPEAAAAARGAEVYFGYGVPAGVAAAARATLRWAHSGTAGVGAALRHLADTRVILTNSAATHAEPTADWVIASIAYFARGLDRMREAQLQQHWARDDFTELRVPVVEFADVRVGVFGLGGIGSAVARRALALGMPVAGVRRRPELGGPAGVRWVGELADLARLAGRPILRASDLRRGGDGRRVRVAGNVIVRQRPGTAKGFVFLSLEDETGIANVIVTPGLFARDRAPLVTEPFVLVEGILQIQDGVVSVRAQHVRALARPPHVVPSHDFG